MGQAAYDMNAVRRRRAPQTRKNVPLRVEKGGKRRLTPFQAAMQHAIQLISVALMVGFAVSLLWSEAQLVELNDQIQDAKAQLVEEAASRLGLMKIDQSQITYIRLDAGSVLVRKESAVHQWTDFLHDGAMTIIGAVNQAK